MEKKRLIAYKVRIKDIMQGDYIKQEGFNPNYVLTHHGQKISRVRVLAAILNTYKNDEGTYAFVVLDDGTESIRVKAFKDIELLKNLKKGGHVDLVGKIREYNDERYIVPEIIRPVDDPNLETLRRMEVLKNIKNWEEKKKIIFENKSKYASVEELMGVLKNKFNLKEDEIESILELNVVEEESSEEKNEALEEKNARSIVLKTIEELDDGEGVPYSEIMEKVGLPENIVESVLNKLLGEGTCYEPRAGKLRIL